MYSFSLVSSLYFTAKIARNQELRYNKAAISQGRCNMTEYHRHFIPELPPDGTHTPQQTTPPLAKYERHLTADFDALLQTLHTSIRKEVGAERLEGSDHISVNILFAVRVYEYIGFIRDTYASITVTLVGNEDQLFLSLIVFGNGFVRGAQYRERTLKKLIPAVDTYIEERRLPRF